MLPLPLTSLMAKLQQPGPRANRQSGRSECSRLAPRFAFDPPLDHRLNCHLAVVTSTFGTRDTIGRIDREDMDKLAAVEQQRDAAGVARSDARFATLLGLGLGLVFVRCTEVLTK